MKKFKFGLLILVIFLSCEKEEKENELCNYPRIEFHGELYVNEYIGSNCGYEYSYTGIIVFVYSSNIDVVLLTNRYYEEKTFVFKIGDEDEKIIIMNYYEN